MRIPVGREFAIYILPVGRLVIRRCHAFCREEEGVAVAVDLRDLSSKSSVPVAEVPVLGLVVTLPWIFLPLLLWATRDVE